MKAYLNDLMTETCDMCGGEGKLFRQVDVDDFVVDRLCDECNGEEVTPILCEECNEPFTQQEWQDTSHDGNYHYHRRCCE